MLVLLLFFILLWSIYTNVFVLFCLVADILARNAIEGVEIIVVFSLLLLTIFSFSCSLRVLFYFFNFFSFSLKGFKINEKKKLRKIAAFCRHLYIILYAVSHLRRMRIKHFWLYIYIFPLLFRYFVQKARGVNFIIVYRFVKLEKEIARECAPHFYEFIAYTITCFVYVLRIINYIIVQYNKKKNISNRLFWTDTPNTTFLVFSFILCNRNWTSFRFALLKNW